MPKAKKTKSGSWKVRVLDHEEIVYDANGEPERKANGKIKKKQYFRAFTSTDPSPAGRRAVEKLAADWLADREDHLPIQRLTVKEAIAGYLDLKKDILSPSTLRGYRTLARNAYAPLNNLLIDSLKKPQLQAWVNTFSVDHSPKTVRNAWGFLTAVLDLYMPDRHITVTMPMPKPADLYVPSDTDIQKLLAHIKGTELEKAVLLAAFGCMRRGEVCGLTADDLHGNIITINKSMVQTENGYVVKSPKTTSSYRTVELPVFVTEKFVGVTGQLVKLSPNKVTEHFRKAVKDSGIHPCRFHDLRHYSASIMHAIGIPDQYIMDRGGWKSDKVLKSVYRNVISDEKKRFTDKINAHFDSIAGT